MSRQLTRISEEAVLGLFEEEFGVLGSVNSVVAILDTTGSPGAIALSSSFTTGCLSSNSYPSFVLSAAQL